MSEARKPKSSRDGFGEGLLEAGRADERVVVLCADLTDSVRAGWFKREFPERFFSLGVSEQDMMGTAAGLALGGKIPFACTFSAFAAGRVWEQIRVSLCYMKLDVKIGASHGGITVGEDGATHQALEEIAILRSLPNMTIVVPADADEARRATVQAVTYPGPVYIRTSRNSVPFVTGGDEAFQIGRAAILRQGDDITLIACGQLVYQALEAAKVLAARGIEARVVNMHTIKPLDEEAVLAACRDTGAVVTCEEHTIIGGLGGAVAEVVCKKCPVPVEMVGTRDVFGVSGSPTELLHVFELDADAIVRAAERIIQKKQ
ncbi:MAG: transketolase family protein [Candidatus Omnitrophica bacterium]|nr:transketolase family protein [Candidatus Omnitrophota bacterium]